MSQKNFLESGIHTFLLSVLLGGVLGALMAGGLSGIFSVETILHLFFIGDSSDSPVFSIVMVLLFWLSLCLLIHLLTRTEKSIVVARYVMASIYVLASIATGLLMRVFAMWSVC